VKCDPAAPFTSFVALREVDTADDEELPRLSRDEKAIFFYDVAPDGGTKILSALREDKTKPFGAVSQVLAGLAGARQASPSPDQLRLYYALGIDGFDLRIADRKAVGDPFVGTRLALEAGADESLAFPATYDGPNGLRVVYIRTGSDNNPDIWTADVDTSGAFVNPTQVIGVNTASIEYDPTPSSDGLTLYFYSENGLPADQGRVWMAQRATANDAFGAPKVVNELVPPTGGYISPATLSTDRCRLYYYAADGSGFADIYVATRTP
jgi:hypothetical protein